MKRLEQLPEVANRQLGGLTATSTLLAKAKLRAAEMRQPRRRSISWRPALAVCAALVLCVGAALWASDGHVPGRPAHAHAKRAGQPLGGRIHIPLPLRRAPPVTCPWAACP